MLGLTLFAAGGCASARPGGKVPFLGVRRPDLRLELTGRHDREDQRGKKGGASSRLRDTLLEERLGLRTEGHLYRPSLLAYTLGLTGALREFQVASDYGGRSRRLRDVDGILDYEANVLLLQKRKFPLELYGRRYRGWERRAFQASVERTGTDLGAVWRYVDPVLPIRLQWDRSIVDLKELIQGGGDFHEEVQSLRGEARYHLAPAHEVEATYERRATHEVFTPVAAAPESRLAFRTDNARLAHRWALGGEGDRLVSELSYYGQAGTVDLTRGELREQLELQHTENLRTAFGLDLVTRRQKAFGGAPTLRERSAYLDGTLTHQLYESLTTRLYVFGQHQSLRPTGNVDRYGGRVSWDYQKRSPWGMWVATYYADWSRDRQAGGAARRTITDERHTFRDPDPVILTTPGILVASLVITNEAKTIVYQRGLDYTVRVVAGRVEIHRLRTGRIGNGQTVLVSYVVESGGGFALTTLTQGLTVRHEFAFGFTPYVEGRWQEQTARGRGAAGVAAEDITEHAVGLTWDWRGFHVLAEYRRHRATLLPFTGRRLEVSWGGRLLAGGQASAGVRAARTRYEAAPKRRTDEVDLFGAWRQALGGRLSWVLRGDYRRIRDSLYGREQYLEAETGLTWEVRRTRLDLTVRRVSYQTSFYTNRTLEAVFQLVRRF